MPYKLETLEFVKTRLLESFNLEQKILKELRQAGQVGGVSLDDSLEDTVIRKTMRG